MPACTAYPHFIACVQMSSVTQTTDSRMHTAAALCTSQCLHSVTSFRELNKVISICAVLDDVLRTLSKRGLTNLS